MMWWPDSDQAETRPHMRSMAIRLESKMYRTKSIRSLLMAEWQAKSWVVVRPGDFPDSDETSDHRPMAAVVELASGHEWSLFSYLSPLGLAHHSSKRRGKALRYYRTIQQRLGAESALNRWLLEGFLKPSSFHGLDSTQNGQKFAGPAQSTPNYPKCASVVSFSALLGRNISAQGTALVFVHKSHLDPNLLSQFGIDLV
jgi:hypothetical protein